MMKTYELRKQFKIKGLNTKGYKLILVNARRLAQKLQLMLKNKKTK